MIGMVKICGLTDAAGVQAAVLAGADAVGFVFAESPRRVTPAQAAELSAQVPARVLRVAVMLHPSAAEWREVCDVVQPRVLQTEYEDFARLDVPEDVVHWPVLREGAFTALDELPETFLYEGRASGRGEAVDWQAAAAYAKRGRMILAGGLSAANVAAAIRAALPWGVDVSSAVESAPGKKDPRKVAAFVAAARAATIHTS